MIKVGDKVIVRHDLNIGNLFICEKDSQNFHFYVDEILCAKSGKVLTIYKIDEYWSSKTGVTCFYAKEHQGILVENVVYLIDKNNIQYYLSQKEGGK